MNVEEVTQAEPIGTSNELMVVITESGVEQSTAMTLQNSFLPFFEKAKEWKAKAESLVVTDVSQVAEMKMARVARLALKEIRVDADKTRKSLKEDSLRYGKAVQGVYSVIDYLIAPIEAHLLDQEKFAERQAEKRKAELKEQRDAELLPYIAFVPYQIDLGELTEEAWATVLNGAKLQYQAKIQADIQAETDRIAKEQADAAQREKERLEREAAIENERLARIELENQKAIMAEQQAKAEKERLALEEKNRKEQEKQAALVAKAMAEQAEKNRIAADLFAKERAEAETQRLAIAVKAEQERQEAAKILEAERAERLRLAAELMDKAQAEQDERDRLAKIEADRIAAEKKAAKQPDKVKLTAWIMKMEVPGPDVTTEEGIAMSNNIVAKHESFKKWALTQIETL